MRYIHWGLIFPIALAMGCVDQDFPRPLQRVFSPGEDRPPSREAPLAAAARLDQVGRQIVAANPFIGDDISFQCIGADEPAIFHRDAYSVFASDKLVELCKTDGELAAVLSTEIGKIVAERRNAARMGVSPRIPVVPQLNSNMEAGGIPSDQARIAEMAIMEQKTSRNNRSEKAQDLSDPQQVARELLQSAGFDPAEIDRAQPILKQLKDDNHVIRQMGGIGMAPRWTQ